MRTIVQIVTDGRGQSIGETSLDRIRGIEANQDWLIGHDVLNVTQVRRVLRAADPLWPWSGRAASFGASHVQGEASAAQCDQPCGTASLCVALGREAGDEAEAAR